ncbi:MAG: membrane protein insertase YidC [Clostridiales bacterium]|nr:membrane protein insertase YidC [Clostridiales bacterium]
MAFLNTMLAFLGEAVLVTPQITAPNKMWHILIIKTFSFIADYGWRIVVFTLLLKLILSPLDFYQRYKMHKNQKITERLKPTMEKIQKQYGHDKQAFSQKQMELNRKEGYSYFSSCLPMIVTMVVFITLWLSMNTVAQYMMLREYTTLSDTFSVAETQIMDMPEAKRTEICQDIVYTVYYDGIDQKYVAELKEKYELPDSFALADAKPMQAKFLWIKNIWAPDVPWQNKAVMSWSDFERAIGNYKLASKNGLSSDDLGFVLEPGRYTRVMGRLLNGSKSDRTNGYLILPVLVVLLSVGSQLITTRQQKRAGQMNEKGGMATSMKVMMFIMPVMMAFFAIQYASIFTMYMVMNTALTLIFNVVFTAIIRVMDKNKQRRNYGIASGSTRGGNVPGKYSYVIHYVKGANPDAGKRETVSQSAGGGSTEKKKKSKQAGATPTPVVKSGRPDPTELMNIDMSGSSTNKKKK